MRLPIPPPGLSDQPRIIEQVFRASDELAMNFVEISEAAVGERSCQGVCENKKAAVTTAASIF